MSRSSGPAGTDRGVSVTVSYILNLAIATMLIGSLLMVTGGVVQDQQEQTIHSEMEVIGQHLAANLMGADRMVQAGGETVEVRSTAPNTVSGSTYSITVNATADESRLVLESLNPQVSVTVMFANTTTVESTTVGGGDLRISSDNGGPLEVDSR